MNTTASADKARRRIIGVPPPHIEPRGGSCLGAHTRAWQTSSRNKGPQPPSESDRTVARKRRPVANFPTIPPPSEADPDPHRARASPSADYRADIGAGN